MINDGIDDPDAGTGSAEAPEATSRVDDTGVDTQITGETLIRLEAVERESPDGPTDPDGDGLYEDVDGDGEVTYDDVVTFFEDFEEPYIQDNPEAFDFNGNGRLDFDDAVELSNRIDEFDDPDDAGGGEYAWLGVSPDAIDGRTNPSLSLTAGTDYTLEWTNRTGETHNFVVVDADGDEVVSSPTLSQEGETQTVEFTATTEMAAYYSDSHAQAMRGSIEVTADDQASWNRDLDVERNPEAATNWDNYEVETVLPKGTIEDEYDLEDGVEGEWMQMAVDPQDRIWVITRGAPFVTEGDGYAEVAWVDPATGEHQLALELPVALHGGHIAEPYYAGESTPTRELGGQGIAFDPNFEENGYVYLMYHPASEDLEDHDNPYHDGIYYASYLVSRFEMADDGTLDRDSEEVVFETLEQYNTCCHHGGYITFGEGREFYISTGDNSNNVNHPTHDWPPDNTVDDLPDDIAVDTLPGATVDAFMGDERQGIVGGRPGPVADAQRTSGNTADRRGKVHRIVLNEDGSYDIPEGNLKEHWEDETGESYSDEEFLPEIYVMGMRNPFTITHDEHTDNLWTASYGNDANNINVLGMSGFGEYHLWCEPGNAGYPYFKGYYPYRDFDFETDEVGQPFWPDNLRNESANNTGITDIPNVTPALLWHPQPENWGNYANALDIHPWLDQPRPGEITYPEFAQGGSADVGVVYRYSEDYGENALDPFFDGKTFIMRPSNSDVTRYVAFNEDGTLEYDEFLPDDDVISAAYDMKVLSDGRLAVMGMYSGLHVVNYHEDGAPSDGDGGDETAEYTVPNTDGGTADEPAFTLPPEGDSITDTDGDGDVTGPDDLSADVYLGYDADNLYVRVEVTDDVHTATSGSSMWQADSLQVAVASDDTYGPEYGFSLTDGTTNEHRWIQGDATAGLDAVESTVSREDASITTVYEAGFPWTTLFAEPKSAGDSFPFGVLVNERDDGDSRDAVLGWTLPGINTDKSPGALGTLTLGPADDGDGGEVIDPGTTIELGGQIGGWTGEAPSSIEGRTNPTLPLRAGETYTVVWENLDGLAHDFDVLDAAGNTLVDSELVTTQGETQTVEFTATTEMAEYYCSVHPSTMTGTLDVREGDGS